MSSLHIQGGYRGFYARNTMPLAPKIVNDIHKRGGTVLGTSRGGHDAMKIVDNIQDRGINQVKYMFFFNKNIISYFWKDSWVIVISSGLYYRWRWNTKGSFCYF